MREPYRIVKSLLRTEKGTFMLPMNKYIFLVAIDANKQEIKHAVEELYKVKVRSVNTMQVLGKMRRVRYQLGRSSNWKKAIVTLAEGSKIEVTA